MFILHWLQHHNNIKIMKLLSALRKQIVGSPFMQLPRERDNAYTIMYTLWALIKTPMKNTSEKNSMITKSNKKVNYLQW